MTIITTNYILYIYKLYHKNYKNSDKWNGEMESNKPSFIKRVPISTNVIIAINILS